jgi:hypothetical protein
MTTQMEILNPGPEGQPNYQQPNVDENPTVQAAVGQQLPANGNPMNLVQPLPRYQQPT